MMNFRFPLVVGFCVLAYGCGSTDPEPASCPRDFCANGGTCVDSSGSFSCDCAAGFGGEHCDTNIDDCSGAPCLNGGTCTDGVDAFTCACVTGFTGDLCAINIDDCSGAPCQNGGTCIDGVNAFTCDCAAGFTGDLCATNIDDCAAAPCQNGGTCTDGVDAFTCACLGAWVGDTCETCTGPIDHTVVFADHSPQAAATIDLGDFSVSGSADVILGSGGLSIQGGTANLRIDGEEYVSFSFDAPVTQVAYVVSDVDDYDGDTIAGEATVEAFDSNGQSLGTPTPVNGVGSKDVSATVGGQRLQGLTIRASTGFFSVEGG